MRRKRRGGRWVLVALAVLAILGGTGLVVTELGIVPSLLPAAAPPAPTAPSPTDGPEHTFSRLANPPRTLVADRRGATVAVFTDGARSVRLTGPTRTFSEPKYTSATVTTDAWVRLAPQEWTEGAEQEAWFDEWFSKALVDTGPDVIGIAMEYVDGAKSAKNTEGLQYTGDASFGPISSSDPDGRAENSDFYDYLGVPWKFPDGRQERPDPARSRSLDCSGYLRMVYGYRLGYPLLGTNVKGPGLPRRAYAMAELGPGVQLMPNRGTQAKEYNLLQPGDLLFFNAGPTTGTHIEHSGIYLGLDDGGHHRFVSSRSQADGPTIGDRGGTSLLDGSGYWAFRFRTARRL